MPPAATGLDFVGTRICPVEFALTEPYVNGDLSVSSGHPIDTLKRVENTITIYRRFRDEVLLTSETGRSYVDDYSNHELELSAILLADSALLTQTSQFLEDAAPLIASLLPDASEEMVLSQSMYDQANNLVQELANAGSSEFSNKALQTWEALSFDEHLGETTTEIWEQIQQTNIHLPLIMK